ncbi:MAG: hypothetical protein AB8I58_24200 [Anaerolineales bacterium]|jgi:uncharacterized protein YgiM (DUF1202 family)
MSSRIILVFLVLCLLATACNLPSTTNTPTPETQPEVPVQSPSETPTPDLVLAPFTDTPLPTETPLPSATPTPGNPLVLRATLCWVGPGAQYDVVSALKEGERVELIGKGSIPDWWIVRNPIYKDPCWVQAQDLQIEPGYNISGLETYYPPPTPTFTPSLTPTATPTP